MVLVTIRVCLLVLLGQMSVIAEATSQVNGKDPIRHLEKELLLPNVALRAIVDTQIRRMRQLVAESKIDTQHSVQNLERLQKSLQESQ